MFKTSKCNRLDLHFNALAHKDAEKEAQHLLGHYHTFTEDEEQEKSGRIKERIRTIQHYKSHLKDTQLLNQKLE